MAGPQGEFYRSLGARLREARRAAGISQEQLARAVNLSRPSIVNIEKGRQPVYVHSLIEVAKTLGVKLEALLPAAQAASAPKTITDPKARVWFDTLNAAKGDRE